MKKIIAIILAILLLFPSIASSQTITFPNRGGTGTSTTPSFGQILVGNSIGTYSLMATSSLNISTSDIFEGSKLFYTDARVGSYITGSTTLQAFLNYWTLSGGNLFRSTGNVGIGTSSPYSKLSVAGQVVASNFVGTSTASSTFAGPIVNTSTATSTFSRGFNLSGGCFAINNTCIGGGGSGSGTVNSGTTGQLPYYASNGTELTATSSLFLATNGDVGIGTTSPNNKLSIASTDVTGGLIHGDLLKLTYFSTFIDFNTYNGTYGNKATFVSNSNDGFAFVGTANSPTSFYTNNIERVTILGNGNVGVGSTSPYAKLSVAGETVASNFTATSSSATSTLPNLFSTNFQLNNDYVNDLTGSGLTVTNKALTVDTTGNWTGTFDGQEGTYFLDRANHTGTQAASTISDFNASVNSYVHASTTIPKTYTANSWTNTNTIAANNLVVTGLSDGCIAIASNVFTSTGLPCPTTSGGSGGGTMSTSTSQVPGLLVNHPNNTTDILAVGSNSTTTAEYFFDPNTQRAFLTGRVGIGTTSPYTALSVVGTVVGANFIGTTTASSTLNGNLSIGTNAFVGSTLRAGASGGLTFDAANGTDVAIFGAGNTSNVTFYGGVNIDGTLRIGTGITGVLQAIGGTVSATTTPTFTSISTTATSTLGNGINLTAGCFSVGGVCIGGSTGGSGSPYPFPLAGNATSSLTQFNGGLTAFASSTIGDGTSQGGLTVSGNSTTTGSAYIAGNIGVGGINPVSTAHIFENTSSVDSSAGLTIQNGGSGDAIAQWLVVGRRWVAGINNSNSDAFQISSSADLDTNSRLTIRTSGEVGVSTSSPGTILSLGDTGANTINLSESATSTFGSGINIRSGCFSINGTCISSSGSGSGTVGSGTTGQVPYYAADGTTITASSTIFLASNGRVGIGSTTPAEKLGVAGNIYVDGNINLGNGFGLINESTYIHVGDVGGSTGLSIGEDGTNIDLFNAGGSSVALSAGVLSLTAGGGQTVSMSTNTTFGGSGHYLFPNANVGIATSGPYLKLSVAGSGVFDGLVRASNFIGTSTASSTFNGPFVNTSTATSTFSQGINLSGGCFAVAGTCIGGGGSGSGTVGSGTTGQMPYYAANGTILTATSSISVAANGYIGIGTTTPKTNVHIEAPSSATGTVQVGGIGKPACLALRDSDDAGWTYVTALNGALSASLVPCN